MARSSGLVLIFLLVLASSVYRLQARKLLNGKHGEKRALAKHDSLFLSSLPKGIVPSSSPSGKGHASTVDEKLVSRHLAAIDRILQSVPSPGVGH